jgi:hypothetical protein
MRVFLLLLAGLAIAMPRASAQKKKKQPNRTEAVVTYGFRNNGKEMPGPGLQLFIRNNQAHIVPSSNKPQKEQQYLQLDEQQTLQVLTLDNGEKYTLKKAFSSYTTPELLPDTATILGIVCKKAKLFIRSNTIEVWYTDDLALKGTPSLVNAAGLGLVLKIVRNGSYETIARKIEYRTITAAELAWPEQTGQLVDDAAYMQQIIESRYVNVPVFDREQINFTDKIQNPTGEQLNTTYRYAGGTLIVRKVKLPVVKPGQTLFAELTQYSNGDAYDRTGSVFMIPTDKATSLLNALQHGLGTLPVYEGHNGKKYQGIIATENYLPTIELMRFFTPFGVRHFNEQVKIKGYNWADSVIYRQDISELLPRLQGEVWLGVFIGNYDKGGHKASLNLKYYPGYEGEESATSGKWVYPIFNTLNLMEMAGQEYGTIFEKDSLTVTVNIPEGVKNLQLRYTTTGHGGWGGGDEFNPKLNEIFVDSKRVYHFIPWRADCGTYRLLNPSSGNFGNGLSSSDLSRSNWCPGTLTPPVNIPLPDLVPGVHTFKVAIPLGKPEGGSFSSWNVAGCLIGEKS